MRKNSTNILGLAIAAVILTVSTATAEPIGCAALAGNLVQNCDFTLGDHGSLDWNWEVFGTRNPTAPANWLMGDAGSSLSQTITDVSGATYQFTFYVSGPQNCGFICEGFDAYWGNTWIFSTWASGGTIVKGPPGLETFTVTGTGSDQRSVSMGITIMDFGTSQALRSWRLRQSPPASSCSAPDSWL